MTDNFNTLIFLKGFNNYFNRVIKKYDTIADYTPTGSVYFSRTARNFNPADGVSTEHVENCTINGVTDALNECDYVLVTEGQNIVSRWFIVECDRTRGNQYKFVLKRDVVADNLNDILNAPCFVEKGTLQSTNPLIYNKEGIQVNQIKKNEIALYDKSGCPWIVGYIARDFLPPSDDPDKPTQPKTVTGKYNINYSTAIDSRNLPWSFSTNPQIVGPINGYSMTVTCGTGKIVYSYGQYTTEYTNDATFTLKYSKTGAYKSYTHVNNIPSVSGSRVRFSTTSPYTLYSTNGETIYANDVAN